MDIYPNYLFPYENFTDDTPDNSFVPEGLTDVSRDNSFEPETLTDMSVNNRFQSEKLENSLQLALDTPQAEREASASLNTGFNKADKTWELIVKYNNSPNFLSYVNSRQIQTDPGIYCEYSKSHSSYRHGSDTGKRKCLHKY